MYFFFDPRKNKRMFPPQDTHFILITDMYNKMFEVSTYGEKL